MVKDLMYTFAGTILGSLIEEGIEEFFPGVGELGYGGEIAGSIAGLLASQFKKDEIRNSMKTFIKFAYKKINMESDNDNISEDELNLFSEKFNKLPKRQKKQIISNFKNLAPYEYGFILDFLVSLQGA